MRERVEALGGTLTLSSPPGGGFVVRARIPWRQLR
jgi:signal transduction histidine kinase